MTHGTDPHQAAALSAQALYRRAAHGLWWLLREIELHPERAADLAPLRGLFCTALGPDPLAVEPVAPEHHRAHLGPHHPRALAADDPRRREPLMPVGDFDPLAHLLELLAAEQRSAA